MGRRPIIIPRHQALGRKEQQPNDDSLAHPLAFLENKDSPNNSFGSSTGCIGIRRHGQQHRNQFSTPEKKIRVVKKRSPKSVLLPLDFIEEGEEEEENQPRPNSIGVERPESTVSDHAVLGGLQGNKEDSFFDENSVFGSIIEEVNESNDFGHDLFLPMDDADFARAPSSPSSLEDQSTGTFGEMMLQQNLEMKYQQERDEMTLLRQQQEEDQMTSMLTNSSISSTSTLERSMGVKKRHCFQNSPVNGKKETNFQRLLKAATQCHQRSDSRSTIRSDNSTVKRRNTFNTIRHPLPQTVPSPRSSLVSPEEQRRVALEKYRYYQNMHSAMAKQLKHDDQEPWNNFANNSFQSDRSPQVSMDQESSIEPTGTTAQDDPRVSFNSTSLDASFESIDDELKTLRNQTLRSNASFRLAESCLSNDLDESEGLVKDLEKQLVAAKTQRDLCRERYELAKDKREKEKELTAIRTLHLEILACSGKNKRSKNMLLERYEHEMTSPSIVKKGQTGILGPMFFTSHERGNESGKTSTRDEGNLADELKSDFGVGTDTNTSRFFEDLYADKSIEDLRAIKDRLEAIKDLFDKARYMVSTEFSSPSTDMLRRQHQSQVMIETAASKYILLRIKNLI